MWPNREETDRLLDDAKNGAPGAVDKLLGELKGRILQLYQDEAAAFRLLQDAIS